MEDAKANGPLHGIRWRRVVNDEAQNLADLRLKLDIFCARGIADRKAKGDLCGVD